MAYTVRKTELPMAHALVAAHNLAQEAAVASYYHADTTQVSSGHYTAPVVTADTINSANATNLATSITLANDCKHTINRHFADTLAHDSAVSAQITTADALTTLAQVEALAIAIKAAYNTHLSETDVHFTNDSTNTISAADPSSSQTNTDTLLNEIKGDFNAHVISAPAGAMIRLVAP